MRLPPELKSDRVSRIGRQLRNYNRRRDHGCRSTRHEVSKPVSKPAVVSKQQDAAKSLAVWSADEGLTSRQRNIAWRTVGQWKWLDRDERLAVLKAWTGEVGCLESIDKLIW